LKAGGSEIMVTEENREEYVDSYVHYIFSKQCENQIKAFQRGFYRVCNEELIKNLFKPEELEQLICGSKKLDFQEFEKAAKYVDGYTEDNVVCKWLWEIVHELTDE
jgi:ubiquitin-protein ligase E3 A